MAAAWYSKYHVLHIVAILILWENLQFYAETGAVFGEEIGKLFDGIRVYDVSQVIRSNKHPNRSEILPQDLYVQEVNTSANYYFDASDCWMNRDYSSWIKGISLIFGENANKADVLAMTNETITSTKIKKILKMESSAIDSVTILFADIYYCLNDIDTINGYFVNVLQISSIKHSIEVGIEYSDEFLKRCGEEKVPLFDYLDHTILRIHVSPKTTMLSYAVFSRHLNKLIGENRGFLRKICQHCSPYIRLENVDWDATISTGNYEKYNALMTSYLDAFFKQNGGKEIFIFSPTLKRSNFMSNYEFFRQNMSMFYGNTLYYGKLENVSSQEKYHLACAHQRMVKLLLGNVQNLCVLDSFLEVLTSLSTPCQTSTKNAQNHFVQPSNTSLSILLNNQGREGKIDKLVEKISEILRNSPAELKIATVYILAEDFNETDRLTRAVNLLQSRNIDIGCYSSDSFEYFEIETANISDFINVAFEKCEALVNSTKKISVYLGALLGKTQDVLPLLIRLDQAKQHYERLYPGKTLILNLIFYVGVENSLYCSPKHKQLRERFQTIQSFGNIQGWSGLMLRALYEDFGVWKRVYVDEKIDQDERNMFPALFRTNAPPTAEKGLPMTYPCIQRTFDARKSNIKFLANRHSGASFQTNLRETSPLSTAELQTLLELALKRFPSVEINADSQSEFKLVEKVVAANAPGHRNRNASTPSVYIEVPLEEVHGLRQDVNRLLSNTRAAVHVSNWETLSDEQLNQWKGILYTLTPNFGLSVQNCSGEINSKLTGLKSLPFMSQVSYIVCNTPPVTPNNDDEYWMDKYLGTLFYIKSYMEHFLSIERETGNGVEVMFRLNYLCSKTIKMEHVLRFLNEVNQHSAAYKIRYFLVRAFEDASVNCSHSWWHQDSYADLGNISNFINREDEYAGRVARIFPEPVPAPVPAPVPTPVPTPVPEQNSNSVYFIIFASVIALLMLGMLAQWIYQRKEKTRILTAREIRQFYNGGEQSNPSAPDNEYFLDFGNMKFPRHYEIPLRDIETEEIIGSGQFGVVHRGILSKRIEVAIKIPRSDCGKEQFKSTLSEMKILCHIGEQLNIVSFLGACTKSIANGKLFIVIEYCKNGSLLQFLRQNRENDGEDASISLYEMNGFALGIASGMEYIAEKRVVHGDLAARNVLLTSEFTCKIADFGLSRRLYEMNEYVKTSQEPLPWRWMAPESLRDMEFTTKSDVWSYGITLWEIFSLGMVPYPGLNWTVNYVAELENGMRMGKAPHATDDIHAKTLECWNLNSEARPSFTELKEYFVGLRNEQYLTLNKV